MDTMKVTTTIHLREVGCIGGMMPHHTQLMPLIEATLECHGKIIVMPDNATKSYNCKTITYRALGEYLKKGTTVIIG